MFLNSVWALVAIASVPLWLRLGRRTPAYRDKSLAALIMVIVILFPVISMSDDMMLVPNLGETDGCHFNDRQASNPHFIRPATSALPELAALESSLGFQPPAIPLNLWERAVEHPALESTWSRPPPTA